MASVVGGARNKIGEGRKFVLLFCVKEGRRGELGEVVDKVARADEHVVYPVSFRWPS